MARLTTDDIVKKYLTEYSWIELVRMPERRDRHFGAKVNVSTQPGQGVHCDNFDIIGNLDADIVR
jgi:hypothetical protein